MTHHVHLSDLQPRSADGRFGTVNRPEVEMSDLVTSEESEARVLEALKKLEASAHSWRDPMGQRDLMTGLEVEETLKSQFPDVDHAEFVEHATHIYDVMDKVSLLSEKCHPDDAIPLIEEAGVEFYDTAPVWRRGDYDEPEVEEDFDDAQASALAYFEDQLADHVFNLERADREGRG